MTVWKVCHVDMERSCSWICRGTATGRAAGSSNWPLAVMESGKEEKHETNTKCTKPAREVVVKIFNCENTVKYQLWGIISYWWHDHREYSANWADAQCIRFIVRPPNSLIVLVPRDYYFLYYSLALWAATSGSWPRRQHNISFLSRCVAGFLGSIIVCWKKPTTHVGVAARYRAEKLVEEHSEKQRN